MKTEIPNLKLLTQYLYSQKVEKGLTNGFTILTRCILSSDPEEYAKETLELLTGEEVLIEGEL